MQGCQLKVEREEVKSSVRRENCFPGIPSAWRPLRLFSRPKGSALMYLHDTSREETGLLTFASSVQRSSFDLCLSRYVFLWCSVVLKHWLPVCTRCIFANWWKHNLVLFLVLLNATLFNTFRWSSSLNSWPTTPWVPDLWLKAAFSAQAHCWPSCV